MLRVSGETIEGPRPSDLFDVFTDGAGDLVLVLLDVRSMADSSASFLGSLLHGLRAALEEHEPLHLVVNELEMQLATRPGIEAAAIILRISQRDARVELLNAGMPPLALALPGGELALHPQLSGPIGRRIGEVHPYEVVPLVWGSTWLALSDGMTAGALDTSAVEQLCEKLELSSSGMQLAAASREGVYDALQAALPASRFSRDDATCVFVAADVHGEGGRFKSGIESH